MLLSYFVSKAPAEVFSYLSDAHKFVSVHPVITHTEAHGSAFMMYETLRFAGIPVSFTYPVTIESDALLHEITMKATVSRIVHIHISFRLQAEGEGTRIEEVVGFRSFFPVHPVMRYIFRRQHALLFERINAA